MASRAIPILALAAALLSAAGCAATDTPAASSGSAGPVTDTPTTDPGTGAGTGATTTPAPVETTTGSGATTAPQATPTSSAAADTRCHTSQLAAKLVPGDPGAGQRHATLVLTNKVEVSCTVYGYGGMVLVSSSGKQLPTTVVRTGQQPKLFTLKPGQSASSQLQWGAIPGEGDAQTGQCQPTPTAVQVTPPDERDRIGVPWNLGPVCEKGTINQTPYVPA